ncbi:MAG: hypothetical protein AAF483_07375 [Planctomycetota bacterium]
MNQSSDECEWRLPYEQATQNHLVAPALRSGSTSLLRRDEVESYLPMREPFLFVDEVTYVDQEKPSIAVRYDLARESRVLDSHFPGEPMWPGVLQIDATGQAGGLLALMMENDLSCQSIALTHVHAARFPIPVRPGKPVEFCATYFESGLFRIVVGQCVQDGQICSTSAMSLA